jgi:LEA14-like dessication related protein
VDESEFLDLDVSLDEPIRIDPRGRTSVVLPLKITYAYLFESVPAVRGRDQAGCVLTGELTFLDERRRERQVPLSLAADFPIFRGLDLHFLPLEARSLTLGGTDAVFKAAIMNPNGFSVTVSEFRYALSLAGKSVSRGTTGGGLIVESRREKEFSVPLLLDFYEIGRELYDSLLQPPVPVRISGTVDMTTPWGTFQVPLEKSDKVPVRTSA